MLAIDVVWVPHLLEIEGTIREETTAVVIDVLRATSTMTVALAHGATGILPVATPDEAFQRHAEGPRRRLIGGERGGRPLPGFHLGNSPREYTREKVAGHEIILTTTNGTSALLACRRAREVWIGCFLNRAACCERLRDRSHVVLVCSGKEGRFCLEDAVCAGAMIAQLEAWGIPCDRTDAALGARALYNAWEGRLEELLRTCSHGRYLAKIGFSEDLTFCARLDALPVTSSLRGERVDRDGTDRRSVPESRSHP